MGGSDFKSINLGLAKVSIQGKQVVRKYIYLKDAIYNSNKIVLEINLIDVQNP